MLIRFLLQERARWLLMSITMTLIIGCKSTASRPPLWTNSLGMQFSEVPLVSREQPDQKLSPKILVAVFETADRDFAAFCLATGQNLDQRGKSCNPARQVSWHEAVAFCKWLTQKERAKGILRPGQSYRLPTDHEWSCAVGIGHLEKPSESAESKDGRIPDQYPWGAAWPPPERAGNLCGAESQSEFPENHIVGYKDCYSGEKVGRRASVPNCLGLHDLSGSLWEWCADPFRSSKSWRVLRGGSWLTCRPQTLLSSHRTHDPENYRSASVGFRCVLAEDQITSPN
jgi:formylglycine-generating enzyme required for sulfatase activity